MYQIEIPVPAETIPLDLTELIAEKTGLPRSSILQLRIVKKSLDARRKPKIYWIYKVAFAIDQSSAGVVKLQALELAPAQQKTVFERFPSAMKIAVVGMGPAGLFAALRAALSGARCVLVERGRPVEERLADVNRFLRDGTLDEESNIQFGEGGAGTFSDGKLTARTKHPLYGFVLDQLVEAGAPDEILYLAKPHIGTDRLRAVVINLRRKLQALGAEIFFGEKMTGLLLDGKDRRVRGLVTDRRELTADAVVLATGYSARDTLLDLDRQGVRIEAKGFAMGYRLEMPQHEIDRNQYGRGGRDLPPAEFFLNRNFPDLNGSVYTFCMCPGGTVIPAVSERGCLVLNGMSDFRRDGRFGNAAIIVSYNPELWHNDARKGMELQKNTEMSAFRAGGGGYGAPALPVTDFISRKVSGTLPESSYPLRLVPHPLWEFYEDRYAFFREALLSFGKVMKGIISADAILIAPETRTSSPVRITRGTDLMSVNTPGLYPCGEGSGYAGGIVSSCIDGLRVIEKIQQAG